MTPETVEALIQGILDYPDQLQERLGPFMDALEEIGCRRCRDVKLMDALFELDGYPKTFAEVNRFVNEVRYKLERTPSGMRACECPYHLSLRGRVGGATRRHTAESMTVSSTNKASNER